MRVDVLGDTPEQEAGATVIVSASLTRGKSPDPGIQMPSYIWRDVVDKPPPRRRLRGSGAHLTYHTTTQASDVRISYSTHIRVDPGDDLDSPNDDEIIVEERLYIQRRVLQELIDRERAFSDKLAARWRDRLAKNLAAQRRWINVWNAMWLVRIAVAVIKFEYKIGMVIIRGTRAFLRGLVYYPDLLLARSMSVRRHLTSRVGRRDFWKALREPEAASSEEKGILLLVLSAALVATVLLLSNIFALALPSYTASYSKIISDAAYNFANVFIPLPLPPELMIISSFLVLGPILAGSGLFLGKVAGSWLLYLVGDSLYDTLSKQTAGRPRLRRIVDWLQARAHTKGFWLLVILNGVPFLPDTLILAFAVVGMRFRAFIGGIALGTFLKFTAITVSLMFVGPDSVNGWLATFAGWLNPFNWFG